MPTKNTEQPKYTWNYDEYITADEFIKRITPLIVDPVHTMQECDGDLWVSDYRQLTEAAARLDNLQGK